MSTHEGNTILDQVSKENFAAQPLWLAYILFLLSIVLAINNHLSENQRVRPKECIEPEAGMLNLAHLRIGKPYLIQLINSGELVVGYLQDARGVLSFRIEVQPGIVKSVDPQDIEYICTFDTR